jgi:hypothetical protein
VSVERIHEYSKTPPEVSIPWRRFTVCISSPSCKMFAG